MNYFHLYKQAAPKNIINKYKVEDPILKLLITKFEKDIDQKQIDEYIKQGNTGEQAVDQFVIDNLLSDMIDNLDLNKEDSPYFLSKEQTRKILEDQARRGVNFANPAQQQQAEQGIRYFRENPEQAIAFTMQKTNASKAKYFKEWIDYLSETELYQENPAFSYMILRSIAYKVEGRTDDPIPLNAEALPQVLEKMKQGKDLDIFETYRKFSNDIDLKSLQMQKTDGENGWIKIPSKRNDPQNFEENVKKLVSLSTGNGWCTASTMAEPYLSDGNFWMYIENGRAAVAVRFVGNRVEEIQGRNNQRPFKYWNVIEKLFDDNNFDKNSGHYKELLQVKRNNEKMESDPNFRKQFIELCKNDFRNLHKIDEKYIDDDMIQQLSTSIMDAIRFRRVFIHELPRKMQNNQEIRSVQKSVYLQILPNYPSFYQQAIDSFPNDKDIYEAGKQVYLQLVKNDPKYYYEKAIKLFPNDKDEFYEAYKQGWLQLTQNYPGHYEEAIQVFPNDKEEFYEAYKQGWLQQVKNYPKYTYSRAIKLFPNDKDEFYEAYKQGWLQHVKNAPIEYYDDAIKLFPNDKEEFYEAYKQGWLQFIKNDPYFYNEAIKLFPNDKDEFYEAYKQGWLRFVKINPVYYYDDAIKLFPNDKDIYEAGKQVYLQLIKNDPKYYYEKAIKLFANDKEEFYEAYKQGYLQLVKNNPFSYHNAIKLFPNDKDIYEAGKQVYLQLVKNDPSYYDDAKKLFPNDKDEFYEAAKQGYLQAVARNPVFNYEEAIQLFPEAKHEFDIAAGKINQEQPKQACGWYHRILGAGL